MSVDRRSRLLLLALSVLTTIALFVLQGHKWFSLWDEGYLWYGVQRVMLGEVPIRDFASYDPGRYYSAAALMSLVGDNGIMSLRVVLYIFQALGLFVGLLTIASAARPQGRTDLRYWLLCTVILSMWMIPRHKFLDLSVSIFLIGILTYLIQRPTARRYLLAGVCVGLAAVFGRNHGVYGALGSLGVIAWLRLNNPHAVRTPKALALWTAGIVVGFLPVILMLLIISGFASAFWQSIAFMFARGATNLPVPIPWPWRVQFGSLPPVYAVNAVLIGIFFVAALMFGLLAPVVVTRRRLAGKHIPAAVVASAFLGLCYAHYAFSRADIEHLAHGIFPLLIGCLALCIRLPAPAKWIGASVLCGASFLTTILYQPAWRCSREQKCLDVEVSDSVLQVDPRTANEVALLRRLAAQYTRGEQTFLTVPFWPGAYALLQRRSPMWEIYPILPRSSELEHEEIERIVTAQPRFVVVYNLPLDGRDDLRFKHTHPLVYQFIRNSFEQCEEHADAAYEIYLHK